jgi:hypothetical protein
MAINRTVLIEEETGVEYFRRESKPVPESLSRIAKKLLKSESEKTQTDKNRDRRLKKARQSKHFANREAKLKQAAIVKGDVKAQTKLDKATAERTLKAFKNVKFLTSNKHQKRANKNNLRIKKTK